MYNADVTSRLLFLPILPHHSQSTWSPDLTQATPSFQAFPSPSLLTSLRKLVHSFLPSTAATVPPESSAAFSLLFRWACPGNFPSGRAGGLGPPQAHAFSASCTLSVSAIIPRPLQLLLQTGVFSPAVQQSESVHFSSVTQSCPTLCYPMNCSTPGLPVHHQLQDIAQIHVHQVGDAIQPSHPLSSPSPPAFNLFQHQGLFQ